MKARLGLASLFAVLFVGLIAAAAPNASRIAVALQSSPETSPPAGNETFELAGPVEIPGQLSVADLQTLTVETVEVTFDLDGTVQKHSYTGVRLWDVLARAKPILDPSHKNDQIRKYVVLTANDGYEVVISLGEIAPQTGGQPYLLAWEEDGVALSGDRGPIQLVTPGDKTSDRYIWGIVTIEVRDVDSPSRA